METNQTTTTEQKKVTKKTKNNTTPVRLQNETTKKIKRILTKLNKKPLGRKIKPDDIISKGLELLKESHLSEIQQATLSNADRLEMSYREYCKTHGNITKDEYLGLLQFPAQSSNTPS